MTARYIGSFPPPFGGVTIKNQLIYESLSERMVLKCLKKHRLLPVWAYQLVNVLLALVSREPLLIGVSAAAGRSRLLTGLLYLFNRPVMRKSLYFMMGGTEARRIAGNPQEVKWYGEYRCIYAETRSMVKCLQEAGLQRVEYYPNCRKRPAQRGGICNRQDQPLRCVFFSLISREKGAGRVLEAAKALPGCQFDFYGALEDGYREGFLREIGQIPNAVYQGIFRVNGENVYRKLGEYDVLLLPTACRTEGVPGILVEAKIASVPAVVSDVCYNREIVEDNVSGVVLKDNTAEALADALSRLDQNRKLLGQLREGAFRSAETYFMDHYLNGFVQQLGG